MEARKMSAEWKTGDRALCVDDSPGEIIDDDPFCLRKDVIYLVHHVFDTEGGRIFISVRQCEADREDGWSSSRFRKLVPACDRADIGEHISHPTTK